MNRVGMLVDATHCSPRTASELIAESRTPVVFSHSAPQGVARHPRNVADEQMKACASRGGVLGINGVTLFLGRSATAQPPAEALFRAIDYSVSLLGPRHVGLGLDYVFDQRELDEWLRSVPDFFPPDSGYEVGMTFTPPELLPEVTDLMVKAGYDADAIKGILGGNFMRVADSAWLPESAGQDRGTGGI
jgi:membrane dipeptidase